MSDEDALLWDSLPKGQKSEIFRNAFEKWKSESIPQDKMILLQDLERMKKEYENLEQIQFEYDFKVEAKREEIVRIQEELRKFDSRIIVLDDGSIHPDPVQFFITFMQHAREYHENGTIFSSPSGQARYKVEDIVENEDFRKIKISIQRIDSKSSKPSSFTYETVRKAVKKLRPNRCLKIGGFMPVLAQECAVVEIHPDLVCGDYYLEGPTFEMRKQIFFKYEDVK
ncbi:MAG: hypothetical protein VW551_07765 [Euryarchaeota archaeon]